MKKIVCYFKISISYGNSGYIWYTITTPSPESIFSFGQMNSLQFTKPCIQNIIPGKYCSGGITAPRSPLMCSRKSDAPLRTCKRGVIAMYTGAGGVGVHQNSMFYIAFNGLPKMDDRGMVYGEIIEGFDVLAAIESVGTTTGQPTTSVRIIECGRYSERKHGMMLNKITLQSMKNAAGSLKLEPLER